MQLTIYKNDVPFTILFDNVDANKVSRYRWYIHTLGYVCARANGKYLYLHRLIANTPDGMVTDHINHNKLDNRKSNLRVCTTRENVINCKLSKNNKSGFRGVSFRKDRNKYRAYLMVDRKQVFLGYHSHYKDAVKARLIGEKRYFGIYAPT